LFSAIALIVLLLACANYMNLAIARSVNRAREVGLRKVVGARRQQLIFQFLGESVLITFLALLLALGLTQLFLPDFWKPNRTLIKLNFLENGITDSGIICFSIRSWFNLRQLSCALHVFPSAFPGTQRKNREQSIRF
jgi:putative ABC transport system permease protein